jgi:hypothetical protein
MSSLSGTLKPLEGGDVKRQPKRICAQRATRGVLVVPDFRRHSGATYGAGITAWVRFEYALSPFGSTAVVA